MSKYCDEAERFEEFKKANGFNGDCTGCSGYISREQLKNTFGDSETYDFPCDKAFKKQ